MDMIGCLILLVLGVMAISFIVENFAIIFLILISLILFFLAFVTSKKNSNENTTSELQEEDFVSYEQKYEIKTSPINNEKEKHNIITRVPEEFKKYTRVRKIENNYTVLDFETTGLDSVEDEIIEIGAIKYIDDKEADRFHSYVYPKRNGISNTITSITGITMDTVDGAPTIDEALPKLVDFIEKENIVAHNASFDMNFLLQNMYNEGIEYQNFRVIDTLPLARKNLLFLKNHKLVTIKDYLKINVDSHDALNDCLVTAALYQHIKEIQR